MNKWTFKQKPERLSLTYRHLQKQTPFTHSCYAGHTPENTPPRTAECPL